MIKEFRKKIEDKGQKLTYFHRKYLKDSGVSYSYMNQQINDPSRLGEIVSAAIARYLADE